MSTTKNGQIFNKINFKKIDYLNKIIKGPGTSVQSLAFSQKHTRNVCHTAH